MTVSAAVRFSAVPPALRLIRNSGTWPDWNRSTTAVRSVVSPVNRQYGIASPVTSDSISRNIEVNCENRRMRRPSATSSGSTVGARVRSSAGGNSSTVGTTLCLPAPHASIHEPRITTHLPELQQSVQYGDLTARESLLTDHFLYALMHGQPNTIVEIPLLLIERNGLHDLNLRRQFLRHRVLGSTQEKRR